MPRLLMIFGEIIIVSLALICMFSFYMCCAGNTKTAFSRFASNDSLDKSHKRIKSSFTNYAVPVIIIILTNTFAITYGILMMRYGIYWIGILMIIDIIFNDLTGLAHLKWTSLREHLEIKAIKSKQTCDMSKFLIICALESSIDFVLNIFYIVGIAL